MCFGFKFDKPMTFRSVGIGQRFMAGDMEWVKKDATHAERVANPGLPVSFDPMKEVMAGTENAIQSI